MASLINVFLAPLVISMVWNIGAEAQSQSQLRCNNVVIKGLSPCLNYVTGNTTTPTPTCCLQLNNVVQTSPQCLCTLLNYNNNGTAANFNINQTLALALPTACNVQTPPLTQCNVVSAPPATAPSASPEAAASPAETSTNPQTDATAATTPSSTAPASSTSIPSVPSASKTVPPNNNNSDGNIVASPFHVTALIIFLATLASNHGFNI